MTARRMPLRDLLAAYVDGDEHGWETEFAWLREHHADRLDALRNDVAARGIRRPILLGSDGRVWDGHHRLCVAVDLDLTDVPVTVVLAVPPGHAHPAGLTPLPALRHPFESPTARACPCNPLNGGSGICGCTLGGIRWTCSAAS